MKIDLPISILEPELREKRILTAKKLYQLGKKAPSAPKVLGIKDIKQELRRIREYSRSNISSLTAELQATIRQKYPAVKVTGAIDNIEAVKYITSISDGNKTISINNSSIIVQELKSGLSSNGFTIINSYLDEFDLKKKEILDYWSLPRMLDKDLMGTFEVARKLQGIGFSGADETRKYMAVLGINAISAEDGTVFFLQHFSNIYKDLNEAKKVILIIGLDKIVKTSQDADFQTKCMGIFGIENIVLGIQPKSKTNPSIAELGLPLDGKEREVHIIILDNGRSSLPGSKFEDLFLCIGCRACNKHCPIQHSFTNVDYIWTPKNYLSQFITDDIIYHMADAAFYTKHNITTLGQHCFWISHVPETITEAKNLCNQDVIWTPCSDTRYTYFVHSSSYGDIGQTWIMFHSLEQQKTREEKFTKKVKSRRVKDRASLKKTLAKEFACEADARMITQNWFEKNPRYVMKELEIKERKQKVTPKPGRPRPDEPVEVGYRVSCKLELNSEFIAREKELLGRFILASNDTHINPEVMLEYYKEQVTVERGFRFIKDQSFHVSEVYLKSNSRIAALSMLMVLCLLVYSVAEWKFRQILKEQNAFVRNQKNRPTNKPTMKRVFFLFRRVRQIHELIDGKPVCTLLNYGVESRNIVNLLGAPFNKYYC